MKILKANSRKNKLIRKLRSELDYLDRKKLHDETNFLNSCACVRTEMMKNEVIRLINENQNLLEYKAKYYSLIKNLKP